MSIQYDVGHGFVLGLADWPTGTKVEDAKHRAADMVAGELDDLDGFDLWHLRAYLLHACRDLGLGSSLGLQIAERLEALVGEHLAPWRDPYGGCSITLGLADEDEGGTP